MCCCIIKTDVLMANLFSKINVRYISIGDIERYFNYLYENFPTYVTSDLCAKKVKACADKYPELYKATELGGNVFVLKGEINPNIGYFNSKYPDYIAGYIVRLTNKFLKNYESSMMDNIFAVQEEKSEVLNGQAEEPI